MMGVVFAEGAGGERVRKNELQGLSRYQKYL